MAIASGARWYVVQTRPHAEAKAAAHLERQGFVTYLPRYLKRRRHARRVETVPAPLFPRYLFVAVDVAAQRWRSNRSTIGVTHLESHGDEPLPVADAVLDELRRRQDERGFVRLDQRPRFAPGAPVRVLEGAFAACLGLFESVSDGQRVSILLELLGRKVRVVLDTEMLEAA
jgi:transcriptional antiterminator RfaH